MSDALLELKARALHAERIRRAATHFATFAELALHEAAPRKEGDPVRVFEPWQRILCEELQASLTGGRLIIDAPPQHGKSVTTSRIFVAWLLGAFPGIRVMLASYAAALATEHAQAARRLVNGPTWASVFGEPDRDAAARDRQALFEVNGGSVRALGMQGGATGQGADVVIIDDPFKGWEDSDSETIRAKVWNTWTGAFETRLSAGGVGARVIMATRWHADDLSGRLLAGADGQAWKHLHFPAVAEDARDGQWRGPDGRLLRWRKAGDPLAPSVKPIAYLDAARLRAPDQWAALYQGRPVPRGGGSLNYKAITPGLELAAVTGENTRALFWTLDSNSGGSSAGADWCALQCWALAHDRSLHLVAYGTFRPTGATLDARFADFRARSNDFAAGLAGAARRAGVPLVGGIEAAAWGKQWADEKAKIGNPWAARPLAKTWQAVNVAGRVTLLMPAIGSKTHRAGPLISAMSTGRIKVAPSLTPRVEALGMFRDQLAGFPSYAHDDDVDGAAMAVILADGLID